MFIATSKCYNRERTAFWSLALVLCLGGGALAGSAATQPDQPAPAPPAQAPVPAAPPTVPPAPAPVPVPDMPVVETKTLEGGLLVEDLKIGDGYEVKPGAAIVAYYHGTLKADPTKVFESSFQKGEAVPFSLAPNPQGGVIAGWQQGLPGMKVGGIRRLTIPASLAWGARGAGPDIPPNSDVIFIVQVVDALQVEDVVVGTGETAKEVCVAVVAHTMKDKDGNVVTQADAKNPYIWIPGEHQGVTIGLAGMKVGGKRTLKVPAQFNISPPQAQSKLPQNVPCEIEIELLHLRNLQ